MKLLAIDPGPVESAWCYYETEARLPLSWAKSPNRLVREEVDNAAFDGVDLLAVEFVASYGMPVGAETFDTCVWVGRFIERWVIFNPAGKWRQMFRMTCKLYLCGDSRAKDANIRQALIDRYGGKEHAIGRKKTPGVLYGISGDVWSALAVAVTAAETEPS